MAGKIRVLIVDDVQESRENVERLLRFEPNIEIAGSAARGQDAIELTISKRPDIVLMDVNMPDMDGIVATRAIMSQSPSTGVIMMSVLNEPDVLRRSMLAGAREFLVKPFSLDELLSSIQNVHVSTPRHTIQHGPALEPTGSAQPPNGVSTRSSGRARVITVASVKGGVGKTTLATNLAVALQQECDLRVAIIDGNISFGDVGLMMNVSDSKTILDAVPYLRQIDQELMSNITAVHASGVTLLLAPPSPQEAEVVTPDLVRGSLTAMKSMFDVIIIDSRASFDDMTIGLFDESDVILLVVTMDMTAIKGARQFIEVTELLGYPGDRVRLVLNRVNGYSGIPAEEIGESLRRPIWARVPDEPGPVQRSINEGVPLVGSSTDSKAASEIRRIAHEIAAEYDPEKQVATPEFRQPRSGLVKRLKVALRSD
ncbi:MAG TPA: response regulator [Thermomicrobiales bacterium]|nr:response regulator [Thermomicrobiales bacterium]